NGGTVCEHAKDADTVIVRRAGLEELRRRYRSLPTRYAEGPDFVKECIRNKKYAHHPVLPRPMGGLPSRGVRQRIEFTYRDEWNLVRYLAVRIPYPETGGRMGNGVYNELMEDARDSDFAWALRHTAHSWREHYKNNQKWFDDMIESIVEKN
ncbi:uncharacterized protein BXZ73DRAFT_6993, partial [Epithele typhae]|uniref:uncharacterized protein n=1 Tax=Epithele typhae TaxID=378194 RepID=UPI002008E5F8